MDASFSMLRDMFLVSLLYRFNIWKKTDSFYYWKTDWKLKNEIFIKNYYNKYKN